MKLPNVMQRKFWVSRLPPAPFQGTGRKRRRGTPASTAAGSSPGVRLRTGPLEDQDGSEPIPLPSMSRSQACPSHPIVGRIGKVLGAAAILAVMQLWAVIGMGLAGRSLGWWAESGWPLPAALFGVHLFGIPGAVMERGDRKWSIFAIFGFWISSAAALILGFLNTLL